MANINAVSAYVLSLGLLTVFLLIFLLQRRSNPHGAGLGIASGVTGLLLGASGAYAIVSVSGYDVVKPRQFPEGVSATASAPPGGGSPAMGGMGMPGGGSGGGMGPMMGGMGGGMGGGRGPNPKRDLTTLVRKLDLLTGDIAIKLTEEQSTSLMKSLADVEGLEKMSDDDAKAKLEELTASLNDDQKTRLDAVGLPFGGGRGGPGGGGPGAGGPGGGGAGGGGGGFGGGGGGFGSAPPDPDANPFQQDTALKALTSFRSRLGSRPAAESAESSKATP